MRHETPPQEIFEEMKIVAISIWRTYDDTFGYATKKIDYINSLLNIQDNAMVFYRMFDHNNQRGMVVKLSIESINYISKNQYP